MYTKINTLDNDWGISFDDGCCITWRHLQQCCEYNYADCESLIDIVEGMQFNTKNMMFEMCDCGFRFGDSKNKMVFVPCYSEQNGYYTDQLDIFWNCEHIGNTDCELQCKW